jgi:hypothetical protein
MPLQKSRYLEQHRKCTYNVTLRRARETTVAVERLLSTTYWSVCAACVCMRACGYPGAWACAFAYVYIALLIQHATRIVTLFVAPRSPPHFLTLSHKRRDFRKKVTEHKMLCFHFVYNFCLNISHSKNNLARDRQKCRNVFM